MIRLAIEIGLVGKFDEESWPFVDWVKEWHGSTGLQSMGKTISSQWLQKRHKTVLVNQTGGPITMLCLNNVDAVLQCWFAGQEVGNALADIISGTISPSGKLPVTINVRLRP